MIRVPEEKNVDDSVQALKVTQKNVFHLGGQLSETYYLNFKAFYLLRGR